MDDLKATLEALLFVADEPVSRDKLFKLFPDRDGLEIEEAIDALKRESAAEGRGVILREVGGGIQLHTRPEFDETIRAFLQVRKGGRLSRQALETLAIIAYEQPITGPEIRELRGADPSGVLHTLLERKLVRISGRKEVVGRPFIYATTEKFLLHFGLASLDDLPKPEELVSFLERENEPETDERERG